MENQQENHDENQQNLREVGSNLTGTAVPAKAGHQRDIPIEQYVAEQKEENSESKDDAATEVNEGVDESRTGRKP
jgi:hypothetical protein